MKSIIIHFFGYLKYLILNEYLIFLLVSYQIVCQLPEMLDLLVIERQAVGHSVVLILNLFKLNAMNFVHKKNIIIKR